MSRFLEDSAGLTALLLARGLRVVGEALVDHHERVVVEVVTPDGARAYAKADTAPGKVAAEVLVLRAAGEAGLPVPQVLDVDPGPPSLLVLSAVEGEWLSPQRPDRAWAATGAVLRQLHQLEVPGLRTFGDALTWGDALRQWLAGARPTALAVGVENDVVDQVEAAVDRLLARDDPPASATLHGDCNPIHVRLDAHDRVVGLLDFGDTGRGDPVLDLAVLTGRSLGRLGAVLDGYGADEGLRRRLDRTLPVYRALRFLGEACWLAEHGYSPQEAMARLSHEVAFGSVA